MQVATVELGLRSPNTCCTWTNRDAHCYMLYSITIPMGFAQDHDKTAEDGILYLASANKQAIRLSSGIPKAL